MFSKIRLIRPTQEVSIFFWVGVEVTTPPPPHPPPPPQNKHHPPPPPPTKPPPPPPPPPTHTTPPQFLFFVPPGYGTAPLIYLFFFILSPTPGNYSLFQATREPAPSLPSKFCRSVKCRFVVPGGPGGLPLEILVAWACGFNVPVVRPRLVFFFFGVRSRAEFQISHRRPTTYHQPFLFPLSPFSFKAEHPPFSNLDSRRTGPHPFLF